MNSPVCKMQAVIDSSTEESPAERAFSLQRSLEALEDVQSGHGTEVEETFLSQILSLGPCALILFLALILLLPHFMIPL